MAAKADPNKWISPPEGVLSQIGSYLEIPKEETRMAMVCRTWRDQLSQNEFVTFFKLFRNSPSVGGYDRALRGLGKRYPRLTELRMPNCRATDPGLGEALYKLIYLESLQVHLPNQKDRVNTEGDISGVGFGAIGMCQRLRALDIRNFDSLADGDLTYTIDSLPLLNDLKLSYCPFSEGAFAEFANRVGRRQNGLEHLEIGPGNAFNRNLSCLKNFSQLRTFICKDALTDRDVEALVQGNPDLSRLELLCTQLGDAALASISRLKQLEFLTLYNGSHLTQGGVQHLASLRNLREVAFKIYDGGRNISLEHLAPLGNVPRVALDLSSDATDATLESNPNIPITHLSLVAARGVTNAGLPSLRHYGRLQELQLDRGDQFLSERGLASLQGAPALRVIHVKGSSYGAIELPEPGVIPPDALQRSVLSRFFEGFKRSRLEYGWR